MICFYLLDLVAIRNNNGSLPYDDKSNRHSHFRFLSGFKQVVFIPGSRVFKRTQLYTKKRKEKRRKILKKIITILLPVLKVVLPIHPFTQLA